MFAGMSRSLDKLAHCVISEAHASRDFNRLDFFARRNVNELLEGGGGGHDSVIFVVADAPIVNVTNSVIRDLSERVSKTLIFFYLGLVILDELRCVVQDKKRFATVFAIESY